MFNYQGQPFTGTLVEYYQNGNIASEEQFLDGHRDGVQMRYFIKWAKRAGAYKSI